MRLKSWILYGKYIYENSKGISRLQWSHQCYNDLKKIGKQALYRIFGMDTMLIIKNNFVCMYNLV